MMLSCSSGKPTSPSGPRLNIPPGLYLLEVAGPGISNDPSILPCTPLGVPASTSVYVRLNLTQDGSDWLGRSPEGEGTLELRLRRSGDRDLYGIPLTGTIRGSAHDTGFLSPLPPDVEMVIEEPGGEFSGHVPYNTFMLGRIDGVIKFRDSAGATGTCPTVTWTLNPLTSDP
jgi:hypothetical protein